MVLALKDTADFPISTKTIIDNDANFNYDTHDAINAYDRTYLDIINANRTKFFPYDKVLIERSTDSGSTWTTVDTSGFSNENRGKLMSDIGATLYLGTGNAALTQQLRVTLQFPGTAYYCSVDRAFFRFSNSGHSCSVTIDASTYGAQSTYTTLAADKVVAGWSGNNMVKFTEKRAWGTNQSSHLYNIRFTFKYTSINSNYPTNQASIQKIDMFGQQFWGTSNSPQHYGHLYSWDYLKNVTFPANVTATRFTAPMFKATGTTYPHLAGNGSILTLSGTGAWAAGAGAIVLGAGELRPAGNEDTNINLGTSGARWKNLYLSGNIGNGTYTYTLPSATGTLALTSNIPTVNDATLTIQKNGTNVQTFTANQSTNATANITVPTSFSDLTGTIGTSQIDNSAVTNDKIDWSTASKIYTSPLTSTTSTLVPQSDTYAVRIGNVVIMHVDIMCNGTGYSFTNNGTVDPDLVPSYNVYAMLREPWQQWILDFRILSTGQWQVYSHNNVTSKGFHGTLCYVINTP